MAYQGLLFLPALRILPGQGPCLPRQGGDLQGGHVALPHAPSQSRPTLHPTSDWLIPILLRYSNYCGVLAGQAKGQRPCCHVPL